MTLRITVTRADGTQKKYKATSKRRLKARHKSARCSTWCNYCMAEFVVEQQRRKSMAPEEYKKLYMNDLTAFAGSDDKNS